MLSQEYHKFHADIAVYLAAGHLFQTGDDLGQKILTVVVSQNFIQLLEVFQMKLHHHASGLAAGGVKKGIQAQPTGPVPVAGKVRIPVVQKNVRCVRFFSRCLFFPLRPFFIFLQPSHHVTIPPLF